MSFQALVFKRVFLGWALWLACVVLPAMIYVNSREQPLEWTSMTLSEPTAKQGLEFLPQQHTTVEVGIEPLGAFILLLVPPTVATLVSRLLANR